MAAERRKVPRLSAVVSVPTGEEDKYHNATVYIGGDDWQFDKFDRWGNRVEQGRIEDRIPGVAITLPRRSRDHKAEVLVCRDDDIAVREC